MANAALRTAKFEQTALLTLHVSLPEVPYSKKKNGTRPRDVCVLLLQRRLEFLKLLTSIRGLNESSSIYVCIHVSALGWHHRCVERYKVDVPTKDICFFIRLNLGYA